jgi:hypothetical protein
MSSFKSFSVDVVTTLLKKPSVTQDQNTRVAENSIIHVERSEKSVNTRDWASQSIWVTEFSVTLVLWSCVTLGFSNSVQQDKCAHHRWKRLQMGKVLVFFILYKCLSVLLMLESKLIVVACWDAVVIRGIFRVRNVRNVPTRKIPLLTLASLHAATICLYSSLKRAERHLCKMKTTSTFHICYLFHLWRAPSARRVLALSLLANYIMREKRGTDAALIILPVDYIVAQTLPLLSIVLIISKHKRCLDYPSRWLYCSTYAALIIDSVDYTVS